MDQSNGEHDSIKDTMDQLKSGEDRRYGRLRNKSLIRIQNNIQKMMDKSKEVVIIRKSSGK